MKLLYKFQSLLWNPVNIVYESICRNRIKNKNFSIICYNCIGGIIYHRLGLEFLSPTVNLFESQSDFWKMISSLRHYMSCDLRFIKSDRPYPVAMLDDIVLYCNHYNTEHEVVDAWNRRKKRIVWDNIFLIVYDSDEITPERLDLLTTLPIKKYIILTNDKSKANDSRYKYIHKSNKG